MTQFIAAKLTIGQFTFILKRINLLLTAISGQDGEQCGEEKDKSCPIYV